MDRHGIGTLGNCKPLDGGYRWFWEAIFRELDIEFYQPYERVVDLSRGIAWPRWCVGAKLNIVHNCLDKRRGTEDGQGVAIRWEGEEGVVRVLTYDELDREVCRLTNALRALGMQKGDVAALFMPMLPETVGGAFCDGEARRHHSAAIFRLRRSFRR
jgi:Acyl-coenzyme A synthetases/AMP-(fatty) acid ligases